MVTLTKAELDQLIIDKIYEYIPFYINSGHFDVLIRESVKRCVKIHLKGAVKELLIEMGATEDEIISPRLKELKSRV